jgi:hypothetical protein
MLIQIQGFDDKNNVKFTAKKTFFLDKKIAIYLSLSLHEDVQQATRKAFLQ